MNINYFFKNPGKPVLSVLAGLAVITCLPAFAQENIEMQEDKPPVFDNLEDRTFELNRQFNNNNINSPFNAPFSQAQFVPDIAFISDFSYVFRDISNDSFAGLFSPGFEASGGHAHAKLNGKNGFNFNYGELALASTVDPYFDLFTNFHLSEFAFEIEEAFISTRELPFGLQLKIGKFLSSFGRLNSQHSHYWDFADQTLVYDTFLGQHGILEKGFQLNWLLPLDIYTLAGMEVLQGENENSFGTRGFATGNYKLEEVNHPNLFTAFIKTSFDFEPLILLGGLSYAQGGTRTVHTEEDGDLHVHAISDDSSFAGTTRIFGLDLTAKYFIDSYRFLSWQSEYLHRFVSGSTYTTTERTGTAKDQSGLYSQLIWGFAKQWRTGFRFDLLNRNIITENGIPADAKNNLNRYTFMIEFNPTEFSRLRLQYNHDRSGFTDNNLKPVNEVFLQFNMAIGAHGAHSF